MNKKYLKKLFGKYLNNRLNSEEQTLLDSWYDSFGDSENIPPLKNKDKKEQIYAELRLNLNLHLKKNTSRNLWWSYAIAASLVIVPFVCYLLYAPQIEETKIAIAYQKIKAGNGKLKKVILPDRSEVWINSGSEIRFNAQGFTKKRDIFLDNGEAFFKVTKNTESPFRVITPTVTTQVYGTSFNVKAYKELSYSSVHVKTGRVKVSLANDTIGELLSADQSVSYAKGAKNLVRIDTSVFTADYWISGTTIINNASFTELALLMYNRFSIRLLAGNSLVAAHHYSLAIHQDKPLEYYLKLISAIHNNQYRRENFEITIF